MKLWGYGWSVWVNLFYVSIILWVFSKLSNKTDEITIAVLGLIYVTIRTIAIGQHILSMDFASALDGQLLIIRKLLRDPKASEFEATLPVAQEIMERRRVKLYIHAFFLFVVSILCLGVLLGALA